MVTFLKFCKVENLVVAASGCHKKWTGGTFKEKRPTVAGAAVERGEVLGLGEAGTVGPPEFRFPEDLDPDPDEPEMIPEGEGSPVLKLRRKLFRPFTWLSPEGTPLWT